MTTKKSQRLNMELKVAIVTSGLTQRALARQLHMDETRLSRLVQGQVEPFPSERAALAHALACREIDLFRPRKIA